MAILISVLSSMMAGEAAPAEEPAPITFILRGDERLRGVPLDDDIPIRTAFGRLVVPFSEVRELRFGARLPPGSEAKLAAWLDALAAGEDLAAARDRIPEILRLGRGAARFLRARGADLEGEAEAIRGSVLDRLAPDEETYLDPEDEIVARRFTIRGRIERPRFRVRCLVGDLVIPREDLERIQVEELGIRRRVEVGARYCEGENAFLDTKIRVRKRQPFELKASGSMTLSGLPGPPGGGNTCGPAGLPRMNWEGANLGALMWRIGPGRPWKPLGTGFSGKADATGTIQFTIHAFGHMGASGSFKVVFTSKKS